MASRKRLSRKLTRAAEHGDIFAVERLLQEGADPNFEGDFFHHPPLIAAHLLGGDYGAITLMLVEAGADVLTLSPFLGWFAQEGNITMVRLLLNAGARPDELGGEFDETHLIAACKSGNHIVVKELIEAGADVNAVSAPGLTPILAASMSGDDQMVSALVEAGANVRLLFHGITPLMAAAQSGDVPTMRTLIDNGSEMSRTVANAPKTIRPIENGMSALDIYRLFHGEGEGVELLSGNKQ